MVENTNVHNPFDRIDSVDINTLKITQYCPE